ncbi:hypothetical protein GGR55DRAFT_622828 [Xylaria sp. FL0064]|nr:hypothetical protein GGR55DRAFT_622828 [Xylaria sp. FL0064]
MLSPRHSNSAVSAAEREPLLQGCRTASKAGEVLWITGFFSVYISTWLAITSIISLWMYWYSAALNEPSPLPTYSVAIIGAGPAGISAAQHLHNSPSARYVQFNVTIYESSPVVGGALALHETNGSYIYPKDDPTQNAITAEDIAGTTLMWNNALFTQDSERALKNKIQFVGLESREVGYYKDDLKIASASRPYRKTPMKTWAQLLWTYGNSVWRGDKLAQDGSLRKAMLKAELVPNIEKIFKSLGVLKPLQKQAKDLVRDRRISDRYATDLLEPQVRRAQGQGLDQVTGFAAMMAAAQEESANSYKGGDLIQQLQSVVHDIDVKVHTATRVTQIKYVQLSEKRPGWLIRHESVEDGGNGGNSSLEMFDKVIMAALDFDVQIQNGDKPMLDLRTYYNVSSNITGARLRDEGDPVVPVHVTFFTSTARLISPWDDEQVLFVEPQRPASMRELILVREIVKNRDNNGTNVEYLYRVLSQGPVLDELQSRTNITWSYQTKIEKAYPVLSPIRRFPSFEVPWAKGFWWTSVIQRAGTSVDLSWLAGKAAAEALVSQELQVHYFWGRPWSQLLKSFLPPW